MTKEEIKLYSELDEKFINECERVAMHMRRYERDYNDITDWGIAEHDGELEVRGTGSVYSRNCYMGESFVCFEAELLTYTDEQLEAHIDELIVEREKYIEEQKRKTEEEKRNKELATLKRLKEKYGDISL